MKPVIIFSLLTLFIFPIGALPDEDSPKISLFNGTDLNGWHSVGGGKWTVENGEIVGETGTGEYGWLVADQEYSDFILELKFKAEANGNSGIQFRSHIIDGVMKGYQAECDNRPGMHTGGVYEEHGRGWLAQPSEEGEKALIPDEWNIYRIQMLGDTIQTWLNGRKIVDFHDNQSVRGIIALQVHSGKEPPVKMRWKDITIIDLNYGEDWTPLFNGKNLEGWVEHGQEKWSVADNCIVGQAVTDAYGYLATVQTYKDFIIRLRCKAEGTGNSGLFYHSTLDGVDIRGVQAEIDPTPGNHTAGLYESGGRGWIALPNEDAEKLTRPVGEWNDLYVRVKGNHVTTYTNGWKAVDFIDNEQKYNDGVIALQLHSGGQASMRWQSIYVKKVD